MEGIHPIPQEVGVNLRSADKKLDRLGRDQCERRGDSASHGASKSFWRLAPSDGKDAGDERDTSGYQEPVERMKSGDEKSLGEVRVPVRGPGFSQDEAYSAKLTVKAGTLPEEDPGNPNQSGTYKIVVTTFLDSAIGGVGYDMMGYAEGPIIKVESPQ